jgi:serine protease AprX
MIEQTKCPICGQDHGYLVCHFHPAVDKPLVEKLQEETPDWREEMGACTRCIDQAHLELQRRFFKGDGSPGEVNGYKIFPTPIRLFADENLTGKGVTICFIDSGFYPHPDLTTPHNRILAHLDITQPEGKGFRQLPTEGEPQPPANYQWHGAMTSVVCAGNGRLSNGLYRGIAPDAKLVLLKVTDAEGSITADNIVRALDWAVKNRAKYRIRIINLSVYDDATISWKNSAIDKAVERAVGKGISVVAAAGNDPNAPIRPPANAPHAITVGGLNDRNTLDPLVNTLYHSTFGDTVDRFQKPDIIAPAIWLAAPILPGTAQQAEAAALFERLQTDDNDLLRNRIDEAKYISPHYHHVDGTSFAAPIVCSVIAQMLEANPRLTPATIREILYVTARKLPGEDVQRQGWGVIQPFHAAQMAAGRPLTPLPGITPVIDYRRMVIDFFLQHPGAKSVEVTGDFVGWRERLPLDANGAAGIWHGSIPLLKSDVYRYKFVIDQKEWMSDPRNLFRENDGFDGFNSMLIVL